MFHRVHSLFNFQFYQIKFSAILTQQFSSELKIKMAENTNAQVSTVQNVQSNSPKKVKKTTTKSKSAHGSSHPKYSEMIKAALKALNERSGSSRAAILKYVLANYSLDPAQANQHLKLALKNGVKAKVLKQTKGSGASGSFKLNENATKVAKKKSSKPKKAKSATGAAKKKTSKPKSKTTKKAAAPANNSAAAPAAAGGAAAPATTASATTKAKKAKSPKAAKPKATAAGKVKKVKTSKPKKAGAAKPAGAKKTATKKAAKPKAAKATTPKKPKSTAAKKPAAAKPKAAKPKAAKKAASPKKAAK